MIIQVETLQKLGYQVQLCDDANEAIISLILQLAMKVKELETK